MRLTLACGRYDRTQALIDDRVRIEGVEELNYLALRPGETFWRMLNHEEFDASEMSLSSYSILRSEGDTRFIAIPVFPSRVFRQNALYVHAESSIREPRDLKGKRIGVGDYQMTAAVWTRGFLQHEYGVQPRELEWIVGRPIRAITQPRDVRVQVMSGERSLEEMLERGEIDALMSVMIPAALGKSVKRLFPNFREVELAYYRKTKIFPIMHTLVLRKALYDANPWLAVSLYRAFTRARDLAQRHMYDTDALTVSLPWVIDEIERSREIAWDYSIEGSRPTLEALVQYLDEQQLTRRRVVVAELFAPNVSPALGHYLSATGESG
ncbi:MAG: ABC transporter substrate-binding protein [Betaproteobacteria bacterium]|nr:MAG: ABC transporter substrate-binding protein [Betaproteobacteria bacterium]